MQLDQVFETRPDLYGDIWSTTPVRLQDEVVNVLGRGRAGRRVGVARFAPVDFAPRDRVDDRFGCSKHLGDEVERVELVASLVGRLALEPCEDRVEVLGLPVVARQQVRRPVHAHVLARVPSKALQPQRAPLYAGSERRDTYSATQRLTHWHVVPSLLTI